jgi:DNA polymerase III epsilon subunit-like protein
VLDTFETFVNPGRAIPAFVEQLTGVTNDHVRDAPRLLDVADDLRRFVGAGPIVGQNVGFDLGFLRREGVAFETPAIDTAQLSRLLMPERQPRNLVDLAAALGVEAGEHHRALPDARTAAAIFAALHGRLEGLPAGQRLQLARLVSLQDLVLAEFIGGEAWSAAPISRLLSRCAASRASPWPGDWAGVAAASR